jgi:lipopolysaccharide/colanic/teichoic acid biosynthesis glycosyltransferase
MHVNGDEIFASFPDLHKELALNHKLKNGPRITRLGIFLRKTSLGELPQLIDVLHGNISLVGPRTITPEEVGNIFAIGASGWICRFCSKPFLR